MYVRRLQGQAGRVDDGEIGVEVGARIGEGAGHRALAAGLAGDRHRPGLERTVCAPGGLQRQRTLRIDPALGGGAGLGPVEARAGDRQHALDQGGLQPHARLGS